MIFIFSGKPVVCLNYQNGSPHNMVFFSGGAGWGAHFSLGGALFAKEGVAALVERCFFGFSLNHCYKKKKGGGVLNLLIPFFPQVQIRYLTIIIDV